LTECTFVGVVGTVADSIANLIKHQAMAVIGTYVILAQEAFEVLRVVRIANLGVFVGAKLAIAIAVAGLIPVNTNRILSRSDTSHLCTLLAQPSAVGAAIDRVCVLITFGNAKPPHVIMTSHTGSTNIVGSFEWVVVALLHLVVARIARRDALSAVKLTNVVSSEIAVGGDGTCELVLEV
jgi:hypothetical protein